MTDIDGIRYCNTGDLVENCTALVEHHGGRFELVWAYDPPVTNAPETAAPVTDSAFNAEPLVCC